MPSRTPRNHVSLGMHVSAARACMPVYDKAMLVAFYFIENNMHLTLEGARGSTAVPLRK